MSQLVEVTLPKLGESILGATVVQWLKQEGEHVSLDEPLLEVSTDKVNSEIPSPVEGVLKDILVVDDEEIEIGALLARIEVKSGGEAAVEMTPKEKPESEVKIPVKTCQGELFSPAVVRLAQREGVDFETLKKIEGSGNQGRVTKKDVEFFLENRGDEPISQPTPPLTDGNERHVKMTGMRKAIADNMVRSFYEAPHASLVIDADVTELMRLIKEQKGRFLEIHGAKLTITSFLMQALVKSIQKFPMLNASLQDDTIVVKRYINVGLAVHIDGGLMVPVIKNCQERNLVSLAKAIGDVADRARRSKLTPDDVKEGTLTVTNFGMTGALMGTPIIRHPEVAIVGVGAVKKQVVVRDDDALAVRSIVYLSLTFDHRVIDGIYGCEFLAEFKRNLESISHVS